MLQLGEGARGGKWQCADRSAEWSGHKQDTANPVVADTKGTPDQGPNWEPDDKFLSGLKGLYSSGKVPRASQLDNLAESQGWTRSQTSSGPIKWTDQNGIVRLTIKEGSPRTIRSEGPHIELRDELGRRIDPYGNLVTRRSVENHSPIEWDF